MSIPLIINGVTWTYPQTGDTNWGVQATGWANAVTIGMLQKAGGSFTLTADVDFGANFGLFAPYYTSKDASPAMAGAVRLGNAETISWRNAADSGDLPFTVDASDQLMFNGANVGVAPIALSDLAALTVSSALETNGSGQIVASAVSSAELNFLVCLTSSAQTQLDARVALAGSTMTGGLILSGAPTADLQAATKAYVDSVGSGLTYKESCVVATTTAGTLASDFENGDTIDGVALSTGDRILIKDQASEPENGIYTVEATGAPTRGTDADTFAELFSATVYISSGTANANTNWTATQGLSGTIGVDDVTFVQQSAPGMFAADGQGVKLTGVTFGFDIDGTTLSQSASGAKVAAGGVTNTEVNASAAIATSKLAAVTASRALVSDGSGFMTAATTTAAEIGFVNGLTSAVQTQLDAKIAASVMTTNNDMIYRAAGVPARIASGADTYVLTSNSGVPTWTDPEKSVFTLNVSGSGPFSIPTSWTSLSLAAGTTEGNPWTRSGNNLTAIYTGLHRIALNLSNVENTAGSQRNMMFRLRNTTDGTTVVKSVAWTWEQNQADEGGAYLVLYPNITDVGKTYQVQWAANGSGLQYDDHTVDSEASLLWNLIIEKL